MMLYRAKHESAELWIVRPDGLKRGFSFKEGSRIQVDMMMVRYAHENLIDEIIVDENEKAGKAPSG
jgi:hypothetical protein